MGRLVKHTFGRCVGGRRAVALWLGAFAPVLGCRPPDVSASTFRQLAPSTVAFSSDGSRYAAWQVRIGSPFVVFDSGKRSERVVTPPSGCELHDRTTVAPMSLGAAGGRFLLNCLDGARLLDVRTEAVVELPRTGPNDVGWESVGLRYVEGQVVGGCKQTISERRHGLNCIVLYDIVTRAVTYRPQSLLPDLDHPGAPPICKRLRDVLVLAESRGIESGRFAYDDGLLARSAAHLGDVRIDRCRGRPTILHGRGEAENFDIRGGVLTWDTGHPGTQYGEEGLDRSHNTITSYNLATRRSHTWALPRLPLLDTGLERPPLGAFGYSAHTRNTVFWFAAHTVSGTEVRFVDTSSVYAAAITR
jgi:hypothetical protein